MESGECVHSHPDRAALSTAGTTPPRCLWRTLSKDRNLITWSLMVSHSGLAQGRSKIISAKGGLMEEGRNSNELLLRLSLSLLPEA